MLRSDVMEKNEDEIRLIHFGKQSGLNQIDPHKMGTGLGARGNESKHGRPEVERSYFYREGAAPESIVAENANARYTAKLGPEHRLYDIGKDDENIRDNLKQQSMSRQANQGIVTSDQYLKAVKDAGYHGFHNSMSALPEVVALFHAHPVEEDKTFRNFEKDERGNVISIADYKKKKKPKFKAKVSGTPGQANELGKEKPIKKAEDKKICNLDIRVIDGVPVSSSLFRTKKESPRRTDATAYFKDKLGKSEPPYTISHRNSGTPQTFILEAHDAKGNKVARAYGINKENAISIHNFEVHPNHQHKAKKIAEGFVSHSKKITGGK